MDLDQTIIQLGFCSKLNQRQLEDEILSCKLLGERFSFSQDYWNEYLIIALAHFEKRKQFAVKPEYSYLEHCLRK